jgi:hypothetical protein
MISDNPDPGFDPLAPKGLEHAFKFIKDKMERDMPKKPKGKIITPGNSQIIGEQHAQPNKACRICLAICGMGNVGETDLKLVTCPACQSQLDLGKIAITSDDLRVAFVYSAKLAASANGQNHIKVSNAVMDKLNLESKVFPPQNEGN